MRDQHDTIERHTERRRIPGQVFALAAIAVMWLILLVYDTLIGWTWQTSPAEYGIIRLLLPVFGLVPMILRVLNPETVTDDQEAYATFVRMTLVNLVMAGVLLLLQLIPYEYSTTAVPADYWAFIISRFTGLIVMLGIPLTAEWLVRLYHYRTRNVFSKLAYIYSIALVALLMVAEILPLSQQDGVLSDNSIMSTAAGILGSFSFLLAIRSGWLINLRKRQKLVLLGLSFVGFPATSAFVFVLNGTGGLAILAQAPALPAFMMAVTVSLLFIHMIIFVSALLALPTADAIDRRNDEVSSLANFARLLTQSLEARDLVSTAIALTCDATAASAAWLETYDGTSRELHYGTAARLPGHIAEHLMNARTSTGASVAETARRNHRAEVVGRVSDAAWEETGVRRELRSVTAVPLMLGEKFVGMLYAAKERAGGFDRDEIVLLNALADQIAVALDHSRLIRTSMERQRLEQEMMIARDLQQRLLPKVMPQSPCYEIHAESRPASMVGGDYYDTVTFSDGTLGLLIADVAGKGASAALYMGMVKGIVQALSGRCDSPRELLARANVALHGAIDQRWFATMTCAQIIEEGRILRVSRAGHCPTLLVRSGAADFSRPKGLGLAIAGPEIFDRNLSIEEIAFQPGDYAIFFSDGLPEAGPSNGDEFGYEALRTTAADAATQHVNPRGMRDAIVEAIEKFSGGEPPADDSTLVVLRWR